MSKKVVKKSANKQVAKKSSTVSKSVSKKPKQQVAVDRNVLLFLVLTLVAAGIMLIVQAQNNQTLLEQSRADDALQSELVAPVDDKPAQ